MSKSSGRKRKGSAWLDAVLVMALVFGTGLILYPSYSEWYNRVNASTAISGYDEAVEQQTIQEREKQKQDADTYNRILAQETIRSGGTIDERNEINEEISYERILDYNEEGIMGYISIPEISVRLPIYHGTNDRELQMGIGHLEGSSMPVGSQTGNCVLVGHTGLPTARMFTDIDKMKIGDTFQLSILDQTLVYEVAQILVVLPTEVDSLRIETGKDLCTLLTCTPYGINDHRLLVIGKRVTVEESDEEAQEPEQKESRLHRLYQRIYPYRTLLKVIAIIIAAIIVALRIIQKVQGREKNKETF